MRYLLILLLAVSSCRPSEPPPSRTLPPVRGPALPASQPASSLTVTYRKAANLFEVLDNVSNWWRGKCDPEYREQWQHRFGVTAEDEQRFAAYKAIRKRYYPRPRDTGETEPSTTEHGLFAPRREPDRFAEAFYGAATVDAALSTLGEFMAPDDVETLRQFYAAYRGPCETLLAESEVYSEIAAALQQKLDTARARAFYRRVADFYGLEETPRFTVLYVWWPPVEHITANNRGEFLILKYNPTKHRSAALQDIDVPVHEFTHHASAYQPAAQKQALTKAFLDGCDMRGSMPTPKILEEPLAEVQQKLFLRIAAPERLDFSTDWYGGDAWVNPFAKAIYDPVREAYDSGGTISVALMERIAADCRRLKASR